MGENQYICKQCGAVGPYHLFEDHVAFCLLGAPGIEAGESFDSWSSRVNEWKKRKANEKA